MDLPLEMSRDWAGPMYLLGVGEEGGLTLARFGKGWVDLVEVGGRFESQCVSVQLTDEEVERLWRCWQCWREEQQGRDGGQVGQ
jgi:hypothetical protein